MRPPGNSVIASGNSESVSLRAGLDAPTPSFLPRKEKMIAAPVELRAGD
jgi:hypothetical protein